MPDFTGSDVGCPVSPAQAMYRVALHVGGPGRVFETARQLLVTGAILDHNGNRTAAAKALGVHRVTLFRWDRGTLENRSGPREPTSSRAETTTHPQSVGPQSSPATPARGPVTERSA